MNSPHSFPVQPVYPLLFYSSIPPAPVLWPVPEIRTADYSPSKDLSEDIRIDANILFPVKSDPRSASQSQYTVTSPSLAYELENLKNAILAQSTYECQANMSPPINFQTEFTTMEKFPEFLLTDPVPRWTEIEKRKGLNSGAECGGIERLLKIRRYKEKLKKWRAVHPINRSFAGRRRVAFTKSRVNGRFSAGSSRKQKM